MEPRAEYTENRQVEMNRERMMRSEEMLMGVKGGGGLEMEG